MLDADALNIFGEIVSRSANDSAYSYTFFRSVVWLWDCLSFVVCHIRARCLSPNSITPIFTETFPRKKSPTQITKVAYTKPPRHVKILRQSPWQVRDKPVCVALMEFSPLHCKWKVGDNVRDKIRDRFPTKSRTCRGQKSWKSATWFVSRTFMISVRDKSATLSGTCRRLSQSRRNGIWAINRSSNSDVIWRTDTLVGLTTHCVRSSFVI